MISFWKKIRPWHTGLILGLATFAVLFSGWRRCEGSKIELALLLVTAIAVGFCVFILYRSRMKAWLVFFLLGLALGLESSAELFWEVPFERQCFVSLVTALFWIILAFILGAVAEFIRSLHRLSHSAGKKTEERINELLDKVKEKKS